MKKRILYLFITVVYLTTCCCSAWAQVGTTLTLQECYTLTRQNYPLIRQHELILKSREYSVSNISKGYYPQFGIFGQATYQSAVTEVPVKFPGNEIIPPEKDQYRIYGEISQVIYDGGVLHQQKKSQEAAAEVEEQKLEVELYKLKERVNQLYFGILMMDEQLSQVALLKKDIQAGINRTLAAYTHGTALKSSLDLLKAELLKTGQRETELKAARKSYLIMLGLFINKSLSEQTGIERPVITSVSTEINRPELSLFEAQHKGLEIQNNMLFARNLPRLNFFAQGGYGRPALNMLSNEFDAYYLGGFRIQWNLSGFYSYRKEKLLTALARQQINLQREVFLFNTNMALSQQVVESARLKELLVSDDEIISLRESIRNTAAAQLENGVIMSSDYVRELNALDQARQNKILHEIQLIMVMYNQQTITGN